MVSVAYPKRGWGVKTLIFAIFSAFECGQTVRHPPQKKYTHFKMGGIGMTCNSL